MNRDRKLLALTLWPEWAWAVFRLDKRVENRTWTPDSRLQPGDWLAIHAGAAIGGRAGRTATLTGFEALAGMADASGWETEMPHTTYLHGQPINGPVLMFHRARSSQWVSPELMTCSAIVGLARYDGWDHRQHTGWDVEDQVHWRFSEVRPLPSPVPCKGRQGLWRIEGTTLERVMAQVGGA